MDATTTTLAKAPTGIRCLDEITGGGLPRGHPTLDCGGPGTGKTLLAMEFLVRGVTDHGDPGVLTGSARDVRESAEERERAERRQETERRKLELERRRSILEAQVTALRQEFELKEAETLALIERDKQRAARASDDRTSMASVRRADLDPNSSGDRD